MTVYGEITYVFYMPQNYAELKQFEAENDLSIYKRTADTIAVRYNYKTNATYPYESKADRKTEPTCSKMEQVDKDIYVRSKDEPQTCSVNGRPYDCGNCEYFRCTADEPQTERPCDNCQEFDCYGCEYKQTEREDE